MFQLFELEWWNVKFLISGSDSDNNAASNITKTTSSVSSSCSSVASSGKNVYTNNALLFRNRIVKILKYQANLRNSCVLSIYDKTNLHSC